MLKRTAQRFGTVIFDCDATLSEIVGIDELGHERRAEIEALSDAAMNGDVPLEQVYGQRLALARPSRTRVEEVGRLYLERLVPDTHETVRTLLSAGVDVRVVSSGMLPAVRVMARALGIADEKVAAVDLHFNAAGEYESFDHQSPVTAADGKRRVVESWPELRRPVMLVGDGATDLEAKPAVDMFVCFAGVAARPHVMAGADAVIRHNTMAPVLALALDREPQDEPGRSVYRRGLELLQTE